MRITKGVALAALIILGACRGTPTGNGGGGGQPGFPVTITDDEGEETTLRARPDRIVTFAPSQTETVFALGLGSRIVGVSGSFDDYPPEARDIESIGGAGGTEPNVEKVVALDADVVLTAFIGGEWKDRLREAGVSVFTTLAEDLPDALADLESVGRLLGVEPRARAITADMRIRAQQVQGAVAGVDTVTCFLELSDLYTVGPGSLEFDLLQRAGCDPITASASKPYPQWSVEKLVAQDPDVYLASEAAGSVEDVTDRPGIRSLTAVKQGRVELVNGDLVSRPGPRLIEGLEALAYAIHPSVRPAA